ncbi:MAG: hypothetical protein Q7S40_10855 [Opitutaceae bacterium]|nr:hypothetical protein [Opitutaceae bacterium]
MESADLKSNSPDDAQLEAWLHANSAIAPLSDDGFSHRVLAALPPPVAPAKPSIRPWLCVAAALIGSIVAIHSGEAGAANQFPNIVAALQAAFSPLSDPSVGLALITTAASLVIVYWRKLVAKLPR